MSHGKSVSVVTVLRIGMGLELILFNLSTRRRRSVVVDTEIRFDVQGSRFKTPHPSFRYPGSQVTATSEVVLGRTLR